MNNLEDNDTLTQRIIGCAIEVHRTLGPGLLESAYEQCMAHEMTLQDIAFRLQVPTPIEYKGLRLDCAYKRLQGRRRRAGARDRRTQECGSADNAAPRTTADVHEGVARGDRPADQFQRPAPHRRGEAISHLAFRAGIQDTVFLVDLFCLHPLRVARPTPGTSCARCAARRLAPWQ